MMTNQLQNIEIKKIYVLNPRERNRQIAREKSRKTSKMWDLSAPLRLQKGIPARWL